MSDSQIVDYLEITQSLLSNRKQWEEVPEIVPLTFKALSHLLACHSESFEQHKTLINEQSLKIKQLELRLGSKISKKDLENQVTNCLKTHHHFERKEEDVVSQYQKLAKQSRYEKDRSDLIIAQEIKAISEIVADKKLLQFQAKTLAQRFELQEKFSSLRQEFRLKIQHFQRDIKEAKDRANEYKDFRSKIQESNHNRSISSNNEQKINFLQSSNRRMNDSLNHIIGHIQSNYFTKDELIKIIEGLKNQKDKSPVRKISKQETKSKHIREDEADVNRIIQQGLAKIKQKESKQIIEFKQTILKQMGKMVKTQVVNNLIDSFQKEIFERYQNLSTTVLKLQSKLNRSYQNNQKQIYVKSEKRTQKKSSPHKSIQSIHTSLSRLQKSISQKQVTEFKRISSEIQDKIKRYDSKLINELDRRQKHLCEVIEQTYNQCISSQNNGKLTSTDLNSAFEKLFESNMFCRYLYIGTKQCKKQSLIIWEKQVLNSLVQNFVCKGETIIVSSPGLYRVQFAMFGEIDTETHLILNGEPIAVISKPQFINSASKKVIGNHFHQLLLLPSKSRLTFRVNQHFYGQAFLSLQKL